MNHYSYDAFKVYWTDLTHITLGVHHGGLGVVVPDIARDNPDFTHNPNQYSLLGQSIQ